MSFDEIGGHSTYVGLHIVDIATGRDVQVPPPPTTGLNSERLRALVERMTKLLGCFPPSELDWSPDGKRLAYVCDGHIYVVRADGSGRMLLRTGPAIALSAPSWSPDGKRIAYAARQGGLPSIYVVDLDGSHRQMIARDGSFPAWSPDGTTIAYRAECGVNLVTPTGKQIPVRQPARCVPGAPVWSPDGETLAVSTPSGIYLMDKNGKNLVRVTKQNASGIQGGGKGTARPSWRPIP
jgi:Tol biopolymer transport system component